MKENMNEQNDSEEVIKNPNRNKPKTIDTTPEYKKQKITPGPAVNFLSRKGSPNLAQERSVVSGEEDYLEEDAEIETIEEPIDDNKDYILMVFSEVINTNTKDLILKEIKQLLFGEHPDYNAPIDISEIVLLKKIKIKAGVYIDE